MSSSRFWAGSSSEEESDHSSDKNVTVKVVKNTNKWTVDSDSDSDDEVRVVRSAKDKAFEQLDNSCTLLRNHMKINDWPSILSDFDSIAKHVEKAKGIIAEQGYPFSYIRTLVQLDDLVNDTVKDKSIQKKMGKENNKSFVRVKGKMKKLNEIMESHLTNCRAHPEKYEDAESSDDDSSDNSDSEDDSDFSADSDSDDSSDGDSESDNDETSEEEEDTEVELKQKAKNVTATSDSDDSDMWPSGSESESDESSSEEEDTGELKGRAKWLKTAVVQVKSKKDKGPRQPKAEKDKKTSVETEEQILLKKKQEQELILTPSQFDYKLKEVVAGRGKKGTELADHLSQLRKLTYYSKKLGPARQIMASMYLVGAILFDTSNKIDSVLSIALWKSAKESLFSILKLLRANPGFSLRPLEAEDQAEIARAGQEEQDLDNIKDEDMLPLPAAGETGVIKISGNLSSFVERLYDEYTKSLQQTDPHTAEYISRLYDEGALVELASLVQSYCDRENEFTQASNLALLQVELHYYKHETIAAALHASQARFATFGDSLYFHPSCTNGSVALAAKDRDVSVCHPGAYLGYPQVQVEEQNMELGVKNLCVYVYKYGDDRSKTRAMLCHIYHHALHDRFADARDLLLMSHLQDTISYTDVPTQILFNRMMAQLGLCAFRQGLIAEAHDCLMEICTGSRTKELLAQGIQNYQHNRQNVEKNSQQEKLEKRRQMPYHMHINMELLECCHLTAAMLLEIPNMASEYSTAHGGKNRVISKTFRRYMDYYDRQVFSGPPENTRDHVIAAAKALALGGWKQAQELILKLTVWELIPGTSENTDKIKTMVGRRIQVEGFRTYLLAYATEYDSMHLQQLCDMFGLDMKQGQSVVSKMMIQEELSAAWDPQTQCIVMHKNQRTKLQQFALQYVEKTQQMVENNERLFDSKAAHFGNKGDKESSWNNRRGGKQQDGGNNNRHHQYRRGGGSKNHNSKKW